MDLENMSFSGISIGLDTSKLDQDIKDTERKIANVARNITNVARRGFNTVVILGQVTGQAVDQSYQLMAQAAFIAAETLIEIAAAETLTVIGAINAGLSAVAIAGLLHTAQQLAQKKGTASVEVQGIISLANEWRF